MMRKASQWILHHLTGFSMSAILGLLITRALYNHLAFSLLPANMRLLYSALTLILTCLAVYFLAIRFAWGNIRHFDIKTRLLWLLLSLAAGVILLYTLPVRIPVPQRSHHLEITAAAEASSSSAGTDVRILELQDFEGERIQPFAVQYDGTWQEDGNELVASGQGMVHYYFDGEEGKQLQILFSAHPAAGRVTVRLDDVVQELDLYEDSKAVTQVPLTVPLNLEMMRLLFAVDIAMYAILVFLLSVFIYTLNKGRPRLASMLLVLLSALLLFVAACSDALFSQIRWDFTPYQQTYGNIWLLALVGTLAAAVMVRINRKFLSSFGIAIPYLLVMVASFAFMSDWNVFTISSDSSNYVHRYFEQDYPTRPPLYPLFIQAATSGTDYDFSLRGLERDVEYHDSNHPLMRVSIAQKLVLFFSSLVFSAVMMVMVDPSLVALLMLWLFSHGFYSWEVDHILSEPLTQAWMFFLLSAFFLFLWKKWKILLPFAAVFCAALVLTRPAGAFGAVLVGAMILWGIIQSWRSYWKPALVSLLLLVCLVLMPSVTTYFRTGMFSPSPMYYVTRIAFALQVAQPEDIALMPDRQAEEFFTEALQRKSALDEQIISDYPDELLHTSWIILANPYQVAIPLAGEMVGDGDEDRGKREELILKVANPILENHRMDYLKVGWKSFLLATSEKGTRINLPDLSFWHILAICCLFIILLRRSWAGFSAFFLILSHIGHLTVIVMNDSPSRRYVEATEFFVLIAIFLLAWALFDRLALYIRQRSTDSKMIPG